MSALLAAMGGLDRPGRPLVEPARLHGPASLLRAQVSSRATALATDGLTWGEFAADTARFHGTARRLLFGGQRTNLIRNPRCEGAVPGLPGTAPTHWSIATSANGISREIVGVGVEGGINYVDLRVFGTASTPTFMGAQFDGHTQFPASPGALVAVGCFLRLVGGTLAGISLPTGATNFASGGTPLNQFLLTSPVPTNAPLASQRYVVVSTTATFSDAATAFIRPFTQFTITSGATIDCTLRIGWPQCEIGAAFASSPILPAIGSPAASTRGADLMSATLASLGIGANGACTMLWLGMIPQNAPSSADQVLMQLSDGSDNNRYRLRNVAAGSTIVAGRVTGGVAADAISLGSMTAGTLFRAGISIDGAGRIGGCLTGGAVQAATGGPTTSLTGLRIGNNASNTAALFGEVASLCVLPFAVSDASLAGLVASHPV